MATNNFKEPEALNELVEASGDAYLLDYSFRDNLLDLHLKFFELDDVRILVRTDTVSIPRYVPDALRLWVCYLNLIKLEDVLNIQHGIYVPPQKFIEVKKQTRSGLSLAYGRRANDVQWLFRLVSTKLACTITSLEDISWELL